MLRPVRLAALAALVSLILPVAAGAAEQKFAYVDLQRVLLEVADGKAAKARLQKWLDERQKFIAKEQEALRKEKELLDKQAPAMTPDTVAQKSNDLQRKVMQLAQKWEQARAEASEMERKEMAPIIAKIDRVVADIAAKEGLSMVFDKNSAGIVFAQAKDDITSQVIRAYDAVKK